MSIDEFLGSPEFKRTSRNIVDDSIKRIFYVAGIFLKGALEFVKSMFNMVVGK